MQEEGRREGGKEGRREDCVNDVTQSIEVMLIKAGQS